MTRLLHIATGLDLGGAETALCRLLSKIDRSEFEAQVVSLTGPGLVGDSIASMGIPVHDLQLKHLPHGPREILDLIRLIREYAPDIVHTWMYGANVVGGALASASIRAPIIWGIHHGSLDFSGYARATVLAAKLGVTLSAWLPTSIICCSESSKRSHQALGYDRSRMVVIPNGFDLNAFRPNRAMRARVREELGLEERTRLIGLVARFHPSKDYANFVAAAARLVRHDPEVHFLVCGARVTWDNEDLSAMIRKAGCQERFHLLGLRTDIPRILAALDIATLSSRTEGFPTVIGEAMASGVPCVATNVGDSVEIIGETGRIVPSADPNALALAWAELLGMSEARLTELGLLARRRIHDLFDLSITVDRHEKLYREVLLPTALRA